MTGALDEEARAALGDGLSRALAEAEIALRAGDARQAALVLEVAATALEGRAGAALAGLAARLAEIGGDGAAATRQRALAARFASTPRERLLIAVGQLRDAARVAPDAVAPMLDELLATLPPGDFKVSCARWAAAVARRAGAVERADRLLSDPANGGTSPASLRDRLDLERWAVRGDGGNSERVARVRRLINEARETWTARTARACLDVMAAELALAEADAAKLGLAGDGGASDGAAGARWRSRRRGWKRRRARCRWRSSPRRSPGAPVIRRCAWMRCACGPASIRRARRTRSRWWSTRWRRARHAGASDEPVRQALGELVAAAPMATAFWALAAREKAAGRKREAADALARGASAWGASELGPALQKLADAVRSDAPRALAGAGRGARQTARGGCAPESVLARCARRSGGAGAGHAECGIGSGAARGDLRQRGGGAWTGREALALAGDPVARRARGAPPRRWRPRGLSTSQIGAGRRHVRWSSGWCACCPIRSSARGRCCSWGSTRLTRAPRCAPPRRTRTPATLPARAAIFRESVGRPASGDSARGLYRLDGRAQVASGAAGVGARRAARARAGVPGSGAGGQDRRGGRAARARAASSGHGDGARPLPGGAAARGVARAGRGRRQRAVAGARGRGARGCARRGSARPAVRLARGRGVRGASGGDALAEIAERLLLGDDAEAERATIRCAGIAASRPAGDPRSSAALLVRAAERDAAAGDGARAEARLRLALERDPASAARAARVAAGVDRARRARRRGRAVRARGRGAQGARRAHPRAAARRRAGARPAAVRASADAAADAVSISAVVSAASRRGRRGRPRRRRARVRPRPRADHRRARCGPPIRRSPSRCGGSWRSTRRTSARSSSCARR